MKIAKCLQCKLPFDRKHHIPRVISQCGHSVCDSCIKECPTKNMKCFTCPFDEQTSKLCRKNRILWTSIDQLPINKVVYENLPQQERKELHYERRCTFGKIKTQTFDDICLSHNKALEFTCCNEQMCSDCLLFTQHRNHSFKKISNLPKFHQTDQNLEDTIQKADSLMSKFESQMASTRSRLCTQSQSNWANMNRCNSANKFINPSPTQTKGQKSYEVDQYNTISPYGQENIYQFPNMTKKINRSFSSESRNRNGSNSAFKGYKYEFKCKIQAVIHMIGQQPAPLLQLIGLQIQDFFIPSIIQTIFQTERKYGTIKLGKNQITDEGLSMLLKGFKNYPYLHTLNLVSNKLTQDCFDEIMKLRVRNHTLTNYYLSGNRIRGSHVRHKKRIMYENGINVFL